MSTWMHCSNPEPHDGHPWESHDINGYDLPETCYYHCPGVLDDPWLDVLVTQRDELRADLVKAEATLAEESVKYRRTITQYELADDHARPVPECHDTDGDGDCPACLVPHAVCPKEWRQ